MYLVHLQIGYLHGLEMLNIFKGYTSKTSILDDFMYYEDRQKIMLDEKSRLLNSNYNTSFFLPTFVPSSKLNATIEQPPKADEKPFVPSSKQNATIEQPSKADEKLLVLSSKPNASIEQPPNVDERPFVPSSKPNATIEKSRKADVKPFVPSSKLNSTMERSPKADEKPTNHNEMNRLGKTVQSEQQAVSKLNTKISSSSKRDTKRDGVEDENSAASIMKIGSLSIKSRDIEECNTGKSGVVITAPIDVVTVGSMPVKVNGYGKSSSVLTVGTISIDPKALKLKNPDNFTNGSTPSR